MQFSSEICLYGGPVFDGTRLIDNGGVVFDTEQILRVFEGAPPSRATHKIDVMGRLIAPGLVDLHSDALEKCIEMRPGVFFDPGFALQNLDRRVAACGITSFCHAISFADEELGLRSPNRSASLVQLIRQFDQSPSSMARHFVHARFEVGSTKSAGILQTLIQNGAVDMISLMDHTPGQGQFKTLQSYLSFYQRSYGLEASKVIALAERKQRQNQQNWEDLKQLCQVAGKQGIPVLSHDDDTSQKIEVLAKIGVCASEFPVSLEAAMAAYKKEMRIFMGAPNLIRDQSTSGHLKASQAITSGLCSGLVSDYYPECLLQAPFVAHGKYDVGLDHLLAMVTANPATVLFGSDSAGRLAEGSSPDVVVIDAFGSWALVQQAWVKGQCVFQSKASSELQVELQSCRFVPAHFGHPFPEKVEENYDSHSR